MAHTDYCKQKDSELRSRLLELVRRDGIITSEQLESEREPVVHLDCTPSATASAHTDEEYAAVEVAMREQQVAQVGADVDCRDVVAYTLWVASEWAKNPDISQDEIDSLNTQLCAILWKESLRPLHANRSWTEVRTLRDVEDRIIADSLGAGDAPLMDDEAEVLCEIRTHLATIEHPRYPILDLRSADRVANLLETHATPGDDLKTSFARLASAIQSLGMPVVNVYSASVAYATIKKEVRDGE